MSFIEAGFGSCPCVTIAPCSDLGLGQSSWKLEEDLEVLVTVAEQEPRCAQLGKRPMAPGWYQPECGHMP